VSTPLAILSVFAAQAPRGRHKTMQIHHFAISMTMYQRPFGVTAIVGSFPEPHNFKP